MNRSIYMVIHGLITGAMRHGALRGADLRGVDLTGVDLTGADLSWADLTEAILTEAILTGAILRGAILRGADLTGAILRGAILRGADLIGAKLHGVILRGATGLDLPSPDLAAARLTAVARAALASSGALDMTCWHTCKTTHCIAGWAIHLAGEEGAQLEREFGSEIAGLQLLGVEAHSHFFDSDESARAWLQTKLEAAHG